jgi:hypothetical protein
MGSTNYDVTINCSFHQTIIIVSAFHSRQSGQGFTRGYYLAASPVFYTRIFRSFVHFRGGSGANTSAGANYMARRRDQIRDLGKGYRADLRWMCIGTGGFLTVFGSLLHLTSFSHTRNHLFSFSLFLGSS